MISRNALFVDTGGWLAVLDPGDRYHSQAEKFYRDSLSRYTHLFTTNLIISETYINVRRGAGHRKAIAFLDLIERSERIQCVWSDVRMEETARDILRRYDDQDFSYVDAVSFALMQRAAIQDVFAFDHHFRVMGFAVYPL
jgi:predicted nucleic acid-binding protein